MNCRRDGCFVGVKAVNCRVWPFHATVLCDFLVINSKLPPILHRFRDIAWKCPTYRYLWLPLFGLTPPPATEGFPWDDLRKIFTESLQMANVPNGLETLPKISIP